VYAVYPFTQEFKDYLHAVVNGTTAAVCQANFTIGREYAAILNRFLEDHDIAPEAVDLIGSHGQTVWHIDRQATLQIGESSVLAEAFSLPVVNDFRVRDIAPAAAALRWCRLLIISYLKTSKNPVGFEYRGIANFTNHSA
jgi:1,6-anhydro-N-acetylmuramate kinase